MSMPNCRPAAVQPKAKGSVPNDTNRIPSIRREAAWPQFSNLNSFPSHFPNSHRKYSLIKRCQVILLVNGIDHPVFPYVKIGG